MFTIEIPSPDGKLMLTETAGGLKMEGLKPVILQEILSPAALTEVLRSPNSRAFVVNTSDGGLVGTWDAYYYQLNKKSELTSHNLARLLFPMLQGFAHCDDPEKANVGVAAWVDDSRNLLAIAEVPPHSSCQNTGALRGFLIAARSWKVIGEMSEAELRRNWGQALGPRFIEKNNN